MKRKTAGENCIKASKDEHIYDPLDIGYALTDNVGKQLQICADIHESIFDENEYFLVLLVVGDPLLKNIRRHKYCALLYLPQPRPQQTVFLYNKISKSIRRLWCLPDARVMAIISEMPNVSPKWIRTKRWVDSFYSGTFFQDIRKEHNISHLCEKEYLDSNREKLIEAGCKYPNSLVSKPFDFTKIKTNQVIDSNQSVSP